jgi:mono/diheme cytochrome c family protein
VDRPTTREDGPARVSDRDARRGRSPRRLRRGVGNGGGVAGAPTGGQSKGDLIAGHDGFLYGTEPRCGDCHTLADAGMTSKRASNLDELKPTYQQVLDALNEGPGAMPSYKGMSSVVKQNIAAYVEYATHQGG